MRGVVAAAVPHRHPTHRMPVVAGRMVHLSGNRVHLGREMAERGRGFTRVHVLSVGCEAYGPLPCELSILFTTVAYRRPDFFARPAGPAEAVAECFDLWP